MKLNILLLFSFLLFANMLHAQDLIIKRDGSEIKAKVTRISQTEIDYKKQSNLSGPDYVIAKREVLMIMFANGEKEIFLEEPEPEPQQPAATQVPNHTPAIQTPQVQEFSFIGNWYTTDRTLYIVERYGSGWRYKKSENGYWWPLTKMGTNEFGCQTTQTRFVINQENQVTLYKLAYQTNTPIATWERVSNQPLTQVGNTGRALDFYGNTGGNGNSGTRPPASNPFDDGAAYTRYNFVITNYDFNGGADFDTDYNRYTLTINSSTRDPGIAWVHDGFVSLGYLSNETIDYVDIITGYGLGGQYATGGQYSFYLMAVGGGLYYYSSLSYYIPGFSGETVEDDGFGFYYNVAAGVDMWVDKSWGITAQVALSSVPMLSVGFVF